MAASGEARVANAMTELAVPPGDVGGEFVEPLARAPVSGATAIASRASSTSRPISASISSSAPVRTKTSCSA